MASIFVLADVRSDVRHAVDLPCSVVRERDSELVSLHAVDLSPGGMRVELQGMDVEAGDRFFVSFQTMAFGTWFYTDAFAARLLWGRRPGERRPSMALRFGSLSTDSRVRIRDALRGVPPHLPQREQRIDYAATVGQILASASLMT
jgi:PilZ domain-containing protein